MKKNLLTLALFALPTIAAAQSPHDTMPNSKAKVTATFAHSQDVMGFVKSFDSNEDDVLTRAEHEAFRQARFDMSDTDGDKRISLPEYVAEFSQRIDTMLKPELEEADKATDTRFKSMAGKGKTHITRARYDAAGESSFKAYQEGKLYDEAKNKDKEKARRRSMMIRMPTHHTKQGLIKLYDVNNDGRVMREEMLLRRAEQFDRTDSNRDDKISRAEYELEFKQRLDDYIHNMKSSQLRQTHVRFAGLDQNKDDFISQAEYQASGKRAFDSMDRNKDGKVDAADAALPPAKRNKS